jgi:hypothetical protein
MLRIWGGLLAVLVTTGAAFGGAPDYFSEAGKDFGPTPRGPLLTHYFTITNTTSQTVTIGTARQSCGCVTPTVMKNSLKPGESTAVHVVMDTRRIPQSFVQKTVIVYVPFFAPTMEEVQLKVSAIARDDMVLSQETIPFGTVKKGKAATASTKLTVYNQPNIQVSGVDSTGGHVSAKAKVTTAGNATTIEVAADLDEKCPVGNWTAELFVKTTTPGLEKIRIPISVVVTTPISVTPESVVVADIAPGKATEHRVMLQGTQAFKILQVKGVDDVVSVKAKSDEASPVHILTIAVKPKNIGDLSRILEIETDNKELQWIKVPVSATSPVKK